jgi:hypothetical protein
MGEEKKCTFFREPEMLSFAKGIGYCDMDGSSAACGGKVKFCEKPDAYPEAILETNQSRNTPKGELLVSRLGSPDQRIR